MQQSEDYKKEIYRRAVTLFERSKAGEKVEKDKHRLEGFMHCGEHLGLLSHREGMALLDTAHVEVFGESLSELKKRNNSLQRAVELDDEAFFDEPAVLRNRQL